jgi:hypothetical protein
MNIFLAAKYGHHTMLWQRVEPLIQGRIQLRYDLLLPVRPDKAHEDLRSLVCVLLVRSETDRQAIIRKVPTIVLSAYPNI